MDPLLRVAVFDGGLPDTVAFHQYVTPIDAGGVGPAVPPWLEHGANVTSAALFGPVPADGNLPRPYAHVDHHRVLDARCVTRHTDPHLYDVLARIRSVMQTKRYQFANLSLGPDYPAEDDNVNPWTAVLDDLLADGGTLLTVAAGNEGEADWESGNARVQVPADGVNVLAVGAADRPSDGWGRAAYSCVGPGRRPGWMKPDLVAYGGSEPDHPFLCLDRTGNAVVGRTGTSYAGPAALRTAAGLRAHFGGALSILAIKALLVHACENAGGLPAREVGWGRLPDRLDEFVVCPDGTVRVVYQGTPSPGQFLRTPIPWPAELPKCEVGVRATFCIASAVDPQDPANYTRCGLDVRFRPHAGRFEPKAKHPSTKPFFRQSDFDSEATLRADAHKRETVLSDTRTFRATSLSDPMFDVHYQTRIGGRGTKAGLPIQYAMVVTVYAPKAKGLYDAVRTRYRTRIEPIRPRVDIPIRV